MVRVVAIVGLLLSFLVGLAPPAAADAAPPTEPALNPISADAAIDRLYQAVFERRPDADGLTYWSGRHQQGMSLAEIAEAFTSSPEFQATYGELSDGDFVQLVYRNVLGRIADDEGLAHWVGALSRGEVSRATMMIGFSESEENTWRLRARYDDSVERLFRAFFDRAPDAEGLAYWTRRYLADGDLAAIAEAFARSAEFQTTYGELDDEAYVALVYENVLGRPADAPGAAHWASMLRTGTSRGTMMIGFSESDEFRGRVATVGPELPAPEPEPEPEPDPDPAPEPEPEHCDFFLDVAALSTEVTTRPTTILLAEFERRCGETWLLDQPSQVKVSVDNVVVLDETTTDATARFDSYAELPLSGSGPWHVEITVHVWIDGERRTFVFDESVRVQPIADIDVGVPSTRVRNERTTVPLSIVLREPSTAATWEGYLSTSGSCVLTDGEQFMWIELDGDRFEDDVTIDLIPDEAESTCRVNVHGGRSHSLVGTRSIGFSIVDPAPDVESPEDAPSDPRIETAECVEGRSWCNVVFSVVGNSDVGLLWIGGWGDEPVTPYVDFLWNYPLDAPTEPTRIAWLPKEINTGVDFCFSVTATSKDRLTEGPTSDLACADWNGAGWDQRDPTLAELERWG